MLQTEHRDTHGQRGEEDMDPGVFLQRVEPEGDPAFVEGSQRSHHRRPQTGD